jgi:EmrB/QacA subfamily drug resistance transporter
VITGRGSRIRLIASVAVAVFMGRLDTYIVTISLPAMARDFGAGTSAVSWVTMGYLLFNCGAMLLVGRLADAVSPRKLFIWGYSIFTAGSLLCGLAPDIGLLILFRCVQGLGGAVLVITTYTAVSRFLPEAEVGGAMGLLATFGALGIAVGSPLGGFLTEKFSWPWVFFVNVPVGIAAIVFARWAIPGELGAEKRAGALDYPGALLSLFSIASFILGLDAGHLLGWASWQALGLLGLAAACGALFLFRQTRCASPLVPPELLGGKRFLLANGVCVAGLLLMGGNAFLLPFFLEKAKGLGTSGAGAVLLVYSVLFMILSPLTGRLADRVAPWRLCAVGMGIAAAACALFAFFQSAPGIWGAVLFLPGLALAYALFMAPSSKQVLGAAPASQKGVASAVYGTLYNLSLLLGVAAFEAFYASAGSGAEGAFASAGFGVPGFSGAYLFGACACAASLLLVLGFRSFGARPVGTAGKESGLRSPGALTAGG